MCGSRVGAGGDVGTVLCDGPSWGHGGPACVRNRRLGWRACGHSSREVGQGFSGEDPVPDACYRSLVRGSAESWSVRDSKGSCPPLVWAEGTRGELDGPGPGAGGGQRPRPGAGGVPAAAGCSSWDGLRPRVPCALRVSPGPLAALGGPRPGTGSAGSLRAASWEGQDGGTRG